MPSVTPTPGFALLTGSNCLKRSTADALYATNGFGLLTVAFCIDPRLVWTAGQNGTIVGKHRTDNNQRQWRATYNAADGKITVELWDNASAVSPLCSRVTTVGVFVRTVFAFAYDGAGTLNLYINGVLSNGTLTGAIPAALPNTTEPVAVGADATSSTPLNLWRGAVYAIGIWNLTLSGAQIATIIRDGLIPAPLQLIGLAPQIILEHTGLNQTITRLLSTWTDATVYARHLSPAAASGTLPFCQLAVGGSLLRSNLWNDALIDLGDIALGEGLTSTYTSSSPFRMWAPGLAAPSRPSHRDGKHDFTLLIRSQRVATTTDTIFIQTHGIELRYLLSSREMYAIVGTDSTLTSQNKKFSFGVNIFPVEGLTVDIVLRYNGESDECDFFIGQTQFARVQSATSSYYAGTTITLADRAHFAIAAFVPMALSDLQVSAFLATVSQLVYSSLVTNLSKPGHLSPTYDVDSLIVAPVSTAPLPLGSDASISYSPQGLVVPQLQATQIGSLPDPYTVSEVAPVVPPPPPCIDPPTPVLPLQTWTFFNVASPLDSKTPAGILSTFKRTIDAWVNGEWAVSSYVAGRYLVLKRKNPGINVPGTFRVMIFTGAPHQSALAGNDPSIVPVMTDALYVGTSELAGSNVPIDPAVGIPWPDWSGGVGFGSLPGTLTGPSSVFVCSCDRMLMLMYYSNNGWAVSISGEIIISTGDPAVGIWGVLTSGMTLINPSKGMESILASPLPMGVGSPCFGSLYAESAQRRIMRAVATSGPTQSPLYSATDVVGYLVPIVLESGTMAGPERDMIGILRQVRLGPYLPGRKLIYDSLTYQRAISLNGGQTTPGSGLFLSQEA